jgi:hypothetical protein
MPPAAQTAARIAAQTTQHEPLMDSSHVATGTITSLLTVVLVHLTHWPLSPLDMTTGAAYAGLLVALAGAAVKTYKVWRGR